MLPPRFWNGTPFLRLIFPLAAGIITQYYTAIHPGILLTSAGTCICLLLAYSFLDVHLKFRLASIPGIFIHLILFFSGAGLLFIHQARNIKSFNTPGTAVYLFTLQEPLVTKPNSFKALAVVSILSNEKKFLKQRQLVILYFSRDADRHVLQLGSRILSRKSIQQIRNSGNPGSFDYRQYCFFNGITYQLYLGKNEYCIVDDKGGNKFRQLIFSARGFITGQLRKYIPGQKEFGLAEAMLIGYKDDLDKDLVQAYSNTGVVHVIAISGLHLGLIYWLLMMLTNPLGAKRWNWLRLILVLSGLWVFSILAGAQASILRAAVMFSFIAIAPALNRKTKSINSLLASAFVLLCYNPFWLWDAGFQLSYAAVGSIFLFFKPVYQWICFSNHLLQSIWKLMAVTIAAQLLVIPISVYHFHQLPLLFLLTNLLAVPLSGIIIFGEIFLCIVSAWQPLAKTAGYLLRELIYFLNSYVERFNGLTLTAWGGLSISVIQAFLLMIFIMSFCYWLMNRQKLLLYVALMGLLVFSSLHYTSFCQAFSQKHLIVYHVPRHSCIELIRGRQSLYIGDQLDRVSWNFHIRPSRMKHRIKRMIHPDLCNPFIFCKKQIIILRENTGKMKEHSVDLVILSGNKKSDPVSFLKCCKTKLVILDSSVPFAKARRWKTECARLGIDCHDVNEKGAFIMSF